MLVCAENQRNFDFHGGLCWFVLKMLRNFEFQGGLCWFVLKCIETSNLKVVCAGLCWVCAGLC